MDMLAGFIDLVLHVDAHLFELVERYGLWIYGILFLVVFCETGLVVTPFLPGDSLLFAAGVVAGTGLIGFMEIMLVLLFAGILGDGLNYMIGVRAGPAIFRDGNRFIKKEYLLKAHEFYERHGGKAIMLARFIPIVRTFAPFVAGIARMRPGAFLLYNVTGCVFWVVGLVSAGYFLGSLPWVRGNFGIVIIIIVIASLLPVAVESARAWAGRR